MQTSVKLQEMMSYSLVIAIIAAVLVIVPVVIFVVIKLTKFKPKKRVKKVVAKPKKKYDPATLKQMYLDKVREIEAQYASGVIDMRQAHILLSQCVREYCEEASSVPANALTLREIEKLNKPTLYNLIKEFYEPEFAYDSDKDIKASFTRAAEVIRTWN